MSAETPTDRLARHVLELNHDTLPAEVLTQARLIVADTVGIMLAASRTDVVDRARAALWTNHGPCTVVGRTARAPADVAAFVNALGAHAIELDDSHSPSLTHPAAVLVPAALAAAEHAGRRDGALVLEAVIAGYDVQARLSKAMGPLRQFRRGFHPLSVCGAVGAAVCAGRVLGLTHAELLACIGLAASQSSGILAFRGDRSHHHKPFHAGVAARNGMYAALLAAAGVGAAPDVLGDEHNALTPFGGDDIDAAELTDALGERFEITATSFKRHPSCGRSHAPIDALLMLLEKHPLNGRAVQEIRVQVAHSVVASIDRRPQLTHNIQHLLATVALAGGLERRHLEPEWAARDDVRELERRVVLSGSDELEAIFPEVRGAVVEVVTADGTHRQTLNGPFGSPSRPFTVEELRTKFQQLAGEVLGPDTAGTLWELLATVDTPGALREALKLVAVP